MNDPSCATMSSEIGELCYLRSDKKSLDNSFTVLHQNDSSDQKQNIEKTTFNPQWLEKYNLVAE